jgi:uncharacterized protein YggE
MKSRSIWTFLVAGLIALLWPLPAQADGTGTVSGEAVTEIKRTPEVLRIHVELMAKEKTLKEALAKLKQRRTAAEKQLAAWGVAPEAITFGDPTLSSDKTDRQLQMEMMVRDRIRRKGGVKKPAQPGPTILGLTLTADVPLKARNTEDLLVEFQDLKQKIEAADLSGMKEMQKLSPQEEELAEEMPPDLDNNNEPRRGQPTLMLIARIPEEERTKALADAYGKARAEATELARAAGLELGPLNSLTKAAFGPGDDESYRMARYYRMQAMASNMNEMVRPGEAVALQPGKVVYRVSVQASFQTKGK